MKTKILSIVFALSACAWSSFAQPGLESSGDGMLNGTYYVRQVFYVTSPGSSALAVNASIEGTITFNGSGAYSFSGSSQNTADNPSFSTLDASGTYVISASGEGYLSPIYTDLSSARIVGMLSHGVFIGSTTEGGGLNDLLIAAPVGSPEASNSTLNGSYTVAYFDATFPGDALFTMTADGSGSISAVNVTAYIGGNATAATQNISGVTYAFSNGAAQVKFGGKRGGSTILAGTEVLYISPDGNFIFGGSSNGYDMFVGVRAAASAPSNYAGLYYQAGLDLDESAASSGISALDSYYGAFQALANGQIIGQQQFSTSSSMNYETQTSLLIYGGADDFSYLDSYTLNSDGSSSDSAFNQHYVSSTDGTIRVGYGIGPLLSINVAFQQPSFSGSGVYLNPTGVVNAASSAPFTAQVSPGEFITLYGTGLADTTANATLPFPTTLGQVQVLVNEVAAPIYYVSPTQISFVVPYGTVADSVAEIYVVNRGVNSNLVTTFTGSTSVGVFTNPPGGLGYAAALHPDYSVISQSSPAQIGETVAVYLAGMGIVNPRVQDGTAAPLDPLSYTSATPLVYLLDSSGNYKQGKVAFSGLAPGYAGLYQINFTVPSGLASGDATLEIIGPDSDTFQALLPLSATTADEAPADGSASRRPGSQQVLPRHVLPQR